MTSGLEPVPQPTGSGEYRQREHALRVLERHLLRDHRSGGRTAHVELPRSDVVRQLGDVAAMRSTES